MPALKKTDFSPRVTWLGVVHDRDRTLRSEYVEQVQAGFTGFPGESHGGLTRPSCSRVSELHPKGTEIRNVRQLSVVSAEELARIAEGLTTRSGPALTPPGGGAGR